MYNLDTLADSLIDFCHFHFYLAQFISEAIALASTVARSASSLNPLVRLATSFLSCRAFLSNFNADAGQNIPPDNSQAYSIAAYINIYVCVFVGALGLHDTWPLGKEIVDQTA